MVLKIDDMTARLALFDLDNTLLSGDSDHAWGEFLISQGLVDETSHRATNNRFYQQYLGGELDIEAYVRFTVSPIFGYSGTQRAALHAAFMSEVIEQMILEKGRVLVEQHQSHGDVCVIVTATNSFITAPIARSLGIETLLATELEIVNDRITGKISGVPCYQDGKVKKIGDWLDEYRAGLENLRMESAIFYTDSINDLALMEVVAEPVAVDPDSSLEQVAMSKKWQIISLR